MRGRAVSFVVAVFGAGVLLDGVVTAQERTAAPGAVIVRPVQVREVRVNQPTPPRPDQIRPSFGIERPVEPGFISRPLDFARDRSIPRQQSSVTIPRLGRSRSHQFRPRFNTGFGVVVGYPVIYPYAYPYDPFSPSYGAPYERVPPAPNTYSNADSLSSVANAGNVRAGTSALPASIACEGAAPCGGMSFDIAPGNAQVFVDGSFAGVVDDFDENSAPLLLSPGGHYVEIRLAGYRTATFDVTIVPGEVTPYQGTLDRLRLQAQ